MHVLVSDSVTLDLQRTIDDVGERRVVGIEVITHSEKFAAFPIEV